MNRKDFFKQFIGLFGITSTLSLPGCSTKIISGEIMGANASKGHLLRDFNFPQAIKKKQVQTVIIGGGVSGLSAAWQLKKEGYQQFELLELHHEVGGNAISGHNHISGYPWGAHYLPVPNHEDLVLISFLKEIGVIVGQNEQGLPIYHEEYLCFEPEERLFINGFWQEGLIPEFGVPEKDKVETQRFLQLMSDFSKAIGSDGKEAFCIPLNKASLDPVFLQWDKTTFEKFLDSKGFHSSYLRWYVNYCLKDDYGTSIENVSAWAGIHYFASRKGKAANTEIDTVLTWPEGNGWLVQKMKDKVSNHITTNSLVYEVKKKGDDAFFVKYYKDGESVEIEASQVIMATPQFVSQRILKGLELEVDWSNYTYAPWMVANITLESFNENIKGTQMCWDNVPYNRSSLGYIDATHQQIRQFLPSKVLTFYLPLCNDSPTNERQAAHQKTYEEWTQQIIAELEYMHPGITEIISNIDIWIWGHGMIRPIPGFQHHRIKRMNEMNTESRLYFAHSDLSGISIFEEAFHSGYDSACQLLKRINHV